jgi:FxsC-like protein
MVSFFVSYARLDGPPLVSRFFDELAQQVTLVIGPHQGFLDRQGIEVGDDWSEALGNGLCTAHVCLALYSRNFFASEQCGREVRVFEQRRELAPEPRPASVLPVLWGPPSSYDVPAPLEGIQYTMGDLPAEYEKYGLARLMQKSDLKDRYNDVLFALADLIRKAVLGQLPVLPSVKYSEIEPLFPLAHAENAPTSEAALNVAKFIYLCDNGRDWEAFHPPFKKAIGILATEVTSSENLHYEYLPVDAQLLDRIGSAEKSTSLVVLIVQPDVVPQYQDLLERFDQVNFRHCTVLIPINDQDESVRAKRDQLLEYLRKAFFFRMQGSPGNPYFRYGISTAQQFADELRQVLAALRTGAAMKASPPVSVDAGPAGGSVPGL